jgi:HAE1 family hydrophobic/amphiphilic exporter-1
MAITVIGGVLLTTFLTLLVIPVVYSVLDRKQYAAQATSPDVPAPVATATPAVA